MKYSLALILVLAFSPFLTSQDTTMVQAWNFDSTTRDTTINFPDIDHNEYEKIIMLYTMRCKNGLISTGADRNKGCGEWDYSCNTSIIDSSIVDSLTATHPTYVISGFDGMIFDYTTQPTYTYYQFGQQDVVLNTNTGIDDQVIGESQIDVDQLYESDNGNKSIYYMYTADELSSLGVSKLSSLTMDLVTAGSDMDYLKIRLAHTGESALNVKSIQTADFQEVYFRNTNFNNTAGDHRFVFHDGFNYNGIDNLLVQLVYDHDASSSDVPTVSKGQETSAALTAYNKSDDHYITLNESYTLDIPVDNMGTINNEVTVSCWVYGNPDALPKNTSLFHAEDADGNRQLNVHLPWSNSRMYWDCGYADGYDRIEKAATMEEIAGQWNHWAFTKNTNSGNMSIYLNGELWQSGSGKFKKMDIQSFVIGSSNQYTNVFNGSVDDFMVWDRELSEDEIQTVMYDYIDEESALFANMVAYYDFNEGTGSSIQDKSSFASSASFGGSPLWNKFRSSNLFKNYSYTTERPQLKLSRGDLDIVVTENIVLDSVQNVPNKVVAYTVEGTDLIEDAPVYYWQAGVSTIYDEANNPVGTVDVPVENQLFVFDLEYYRKTPSKFELLSFVTPYGIGLDFGFGGKTWEFDLTDFGPILKGNKRLLMDRGGQWQEQMDIKFLFIKGTPVRNVRSIRQVWPVISTSYTNLLSNSRFEPRIIDLDPDVKYLKLKAAVTGHGQEGEFIPRTHSLNLNGGPAEMFWQGWTECSNNPVYPQGGTWIYDRAGWCPGAPTDVHEWEVLSAVQGEDQFSLDYGINTANGTSNYIVNIQMIEYDEANFSNDVSMDRIIAPSRDIEFFRFNPICDSPIVRIKNTGASQLTSADIYYGVEGKDLLKYTWNGNIGFLETVDVRLPFFGEGRWSAGNTFIARVENPNGVQDEYENNNELKEDFYPVGYISGDLVVEMRTNLVPGESRWVLIDSNNETVATSASALSHSTTYTDTITGLNGCYKLRFLDSGQDGISWWANSDGNGYIRLRSTDGTWITLEPDFGQEITYSFTTGELVPTNELVVSDHDMLIIPNPTSSSVVLELTGFENQLQVVVYDQYGKLIQDVRKTTVDPNYERMQIDLGTFPDGVYLIKAKDGNKMITKKVVKQQ